MLGFPYQKEAGKFLEELRERVREFGLEPHPEKTRRMEFASLDFHGPTQQSRSGLTLGISGTESVALQTTLLPGSFSARAICRLVLAC